jgi:enoyl-CoA hydratase/carnithine racemase
VPDSPEAIRVERDGPVVTVTLCRPERRNALDGSVVAELRDAVRPLAEDPDLRVVVFRGDGPVFCGGANVAAPDRPGFTPDAASWAHRRHEAARFQRLLAELDDLAAVTVAAVQGWAIGGGFLLALACDLRVSTLDARFSLAELRFGLPITAGGVQRLAREVGVSRAREILLTGRRVDAAEAAEIGLVHRVVDDLDEAVPGLVEELLAIPAPAQAITKRALVALGGTDLDLAWADPELHAWAATEPSVIDAVGRARGEPGKP